VTRGRSIVLGALGVMFVLITVRSVTTKPGLPSPSLYVGSLVLFSLWYLLAGVSPGLGGTLAIGTDVSALLAPYIAGGSGTSPLTQLAGLVQGISGGNTNTQGAPAA
jgi:hypothetical protein